MRKLMTALTGVTIAISAPAAAQDAAGYWQGTLTVSGTLTLRVGVTIERADDGTLTGTLDSPDQNAFGIPLERIALDGGKLSFVIPAISASYEGTWDPATQSWDGSFNQMGNARALVLAAGDPATKPAPEPLPDEWTVPGDTALGSLLEERIALREGAGMVLGVIEPEGTRIVARGPAGGTGFDGDTVFEIGSMTKVFTALLLADMALGGTVALDDPVQKYLPEGATMPSRGGKQITLRHLTMQNSGLPRLPDNMPFGDPEDPYADYTGEQLLEFLAGHELVRDPGAEYEYSNLGIGLLGYALARAGGSDYETLLRRRILAPLEMGDTAIGLSPAMQARFATPHDQFMRETKPWTLPTLAGAGALRSTANDMLKFLAAALDPASPIGPAMELTLSDRLGDAGSPQTALGWMILTAPAGEVLQHGGGTGGFRSFMALQPATGRAAVGLTNSAVEPSAQDIVLYTLVGAPVAYALPVPEAPPPPPEREEVTLTEAQLEHVAGTYELAPEVTITVRREGAQLTAQVTGQPPFPIYPTGPLTFFWKVVEAEVRFTEENGEVTGGVFSQGGQDVPVKKVE
jgi:CubicO group peptidase (beta-lactamase class C family)